jgi:hypothetical protein
MITPDQMVALEVAAQGVLHQEPFDKIRQSIDRVAAEAGNKGIDRMSIRALPLRGAFLHAIGSRVIEAIEADPIPNVFKDTGLAAYERYQALTSDMERTIGHVVVTGLLAKEGTFAYAFAYFDKQRSHYLTPGANNEARLNRQGKVMDKNPLPSQAHLSDLVAKNNTGVSTALLLQRTMQIYREEGTLPSGEDIGARLRGEYIKLADLVHAPSSVYHHSTLGRELAQKHFQRIRKENKAELGVSAWPRLFVQCLRTGIRPPLAQEMAASLRKHEAVTYQKFGYCGAQFWLRPLEWHDELGVAQRAATNFFERHGVVLHGTFRLADYQLLHDIDIAQDTILADEDCRSALQMLADSEPPT